MQKFILRPSIDLYPGIRVDKDSTLEFQNENVEQKLENLEFHSVTKSNGKDYESLYETTIHLHEGDVLVFVGENRGYIKPTEPLVTIGEAIEDLENIKDLG